MWPHRPEVKFIVQDKESALFLMPCEGDVGFTPWAHEAGRFEGLTAIGRYAKAEYFFQMPTGFNNDLVVGDQLLTRSFEPGIFQHREIDPVDHAGLSSRRTANHYRLDFSTVGHDQLDLAQVLFADACPNIRFGAI